MTDKTADNTQKKQKILILASNPTGTGRLRLDVEMREIDDGLQLAEHRDQFEIVQRHAVRIKDLRRALLKVRPQIVHFCGHGFKQGKATSKASRAQFS